MTTVVEKPIRSETVFFPMRFEKVNKVDRPHLTGVCSRCWKPLTDRVWMAHSTPENGWETDEEYGDFILCEPCGDRAVREYGKKNK